MAAALGVRPAIKNIGGDGSYTKGCCLIGLGDWYTSVTFYQLKYVFLQVALAEVWMKEAPLCFVHSGHSSPLCPALYHFAPS